MDTVTYPDERVQKLIADRFEPVKVDISRVSDALRELLRTVRPQWGPVLVIQEPSGVELRRWTGWLEPLEFMAELQLALGQRLMISRRFSEAIAEFDTAKALAPETESAAEALFWIGACRYRDGNRRDLAGLRETWEQLMWEFPRSRWARKTDVFDPET